MAASGKKRVCGFFEHCCNLGRALGNERFLLLLVLLLVFGLRLVYSTIPILNWDESTYFTIAQDFTRGIPPYTSYFDTKGPVVYFLLAIPIGIFGKSIFAIRIFTTLLLLCSVFFVYLVSRRFLGKTAALVPALFFGLFFSTSEFDGISSNGEIFMMLPAVIAAYFFVEYRWGKKSPFFSLFLCGFFSALAISTKYSAFFSIVIFPLVLVFDGFRQKRAIVLAKGLFPFLLGFAAVIFAIILYFALNNALLDAYYNFFAYGLMLLRHIPFEQSFQNLVSLLKYYMFYSVLPFFAFVGAIFIFLKRRALSYFQRQFAFFSALLAVFSLAGVFSGKYICQHYFLQMSFPFALLFGLAASIAVPSSQDLKKIMVSFLIVLLAAAYSPGNIASFFENYGSQGNDDNYRVSEYLAANTAESERIFVFFGGEPLIYFLSGRRGASKQPVFPIPYQDPAMASLVESQVLEEFSTAAPKYIVFSGSGTDFPRLKEYMLQNYKEEATIGKYSVYKIKEKK